MTRSRFAILLLAAAFTGLSACSHEKRAVEERADFWQRASASDAAYQRGPKAQQMLHRDISRCVTEIRELERLSAIRMATPGDTTEYEETPDPDTPAGSVAQWETPEREGYLRAEHLPYHDFETCMIDKGWERVEYLPYDIAEKSRENYVESILGQQYRTKTGERGFRYEEEEGEWDNLND